MTRYLLDTDALIDFSKGRDPAYSHVLQWIDADDVLAVCEVTVAEFYAGLSVQQAEEWEEFIAFVSYWDVSAKSAMQAGQDRRRFASEGRTISTTDALIAATARDHEAILVTGNVKDYPMTDITLFPLTGDAQG